MKRRQVWIMYSGWILLLLLLTSSIVISRWTKTSDYSSFQALSWADNYQLYRGILQCSLTSEELVERKQQLKHQVLSKKLKREKSPSGIVYFFDDDKELLNSIFEFVQKEKECCPFFKFDVSILPFEKGMALQISGSEEALQFFEDFEKNEM